MASPCSFCIAKGEFKLLLLHSKRMREMVQRREACLFGKFFVAGPFPGGRKASWTITQRRKALR
jgi:hypothetical protein